MSNAKMSEALEKLLAGFKAGGPCATCEDCGVQFGSWSKEHKDATGTVWLDQARRSTTVCWDCDERREAEKARQRRIRRALEANIPRRFEAATLASYRCPPGNAKALEVAKAWSATGHLGLYLWSNEKGTGKSHLAYSLARREIEAGRRVYATDSGRLFARMRATFHRKSGEAGETIDDVMAEVEGCDLLILDDLGTEKPTEWVLEQLFAIVNTRYLDESPVVITSNHSVPELAMRLGEVAGDRIASRLMEMCQPIQVKANDYRIHGRTA